MKFFIKTFGCQYNEWDATRLAFVLKNTGLTDTSANDADIVFLLNCSVRKTGVDRAMGFAKNFLKENKTVFVSGCVLKEDRKKFIEKGAKIWSEDDIAQLENILGLDHNILTKLFENSQRTTNYIPIMKGCNNFCSYCAVPFTRGREVSRSVEDIIQNVKDVLEAGYKEVWLLGQNVNSYQRQESKSKTGQSVKNKNDNSEFKNHFARLLEQINNIAGDFTINFTSNHPKDMSDEIIEAIATLPKVAKSIHLPLQSGSNTILKAMNRPYTKEQYIELVNRITARIPNVRLSTDTIVGFPGETEEDFQETIDVFKKIKFCQAFNNKYSPREGTAAWQLGDPVPWEEKKRRWRMLNEITHKKK